MRFTYNPPGTNWINGSETGSVYLWELVENGLAPEAWRRANIVINLSKEEKQAWLIVQLLSPYSKSWEEGREKLQTTSS